MPAKLCFKSGSGTIIDFIYSKIEGLWLEGITKDDTFAMI
jgi:hypothetical protein